MLASHDCHCPQGREGRLPTGPTACDALPPTKLHRELQVDQRQALLPRLTREERELIDMELHMEEHLWEQCQQVGMQWGGRGQCMPSSALPWPLGPALLTLGPCLVPGACLGLLPGGSHHRGPAGAGAALPGQVGGAALLGGHLGDVGVRHGRGGRAGSGAGLPGELWGGGVQWCSWGPVQAAVLNFQC